MGLFMKDSLENSLSTSFGTPHLHLCYPIYKKIIDQGNATPTDQSLDVPSTVTFRVFLVHIQGIEIFSLAVGLPPHCRGYMLV